jgi:hypothetical protein
MQNSSRRSAPVRPRRRATRPTGAGASAPAAVIPPASVRQVTGALPGVNPAAPQPERVPAGLGHYEHSYDVTFGYTGDTRLLQR